MWATAHNKGEGGGRWLVVYFISEHEDPATNIPFHCCNLWVALENSSNLITDWTELYRDSIRILRKPIVKIKI